MHHLRRRGIVVSVCSKNKDVVRERWSRAVQLPWISLDDFIAPKINWNHKSETVRAILSELSLSAKSAVFVDDNPVERSEVLNRVPGMRAIGANPCVTRWILLWAAEIQRSLMTAESAKRETSYRAIIDRNAEMALTDRETFLQNLQTAIELDHHIPQYSASGRGGTWALTIPTCPTMSFPWTSIRGLLTDPWRAAPDGCTSILDAEAFGTPIIVVAAHLSCPRHPLTLNYVENSGYCERASTWLDAASSIGRWKRTVCKSSKRLKTPYSEAWLRGRTSYSGVGS